MIDKFPNSDIVLCDECKTLPVPRGIKPCPICLSNYMRADLLACEKCAKENHCRRCGTSLEKTEKDKLCYIEDSQFCYYLHVDGQRIGFLGWEEADYFKEHYEKLGYKVVLGAPND